VYVPLALMRSSRAVELDLAARRMTPPWQAALGDAARRTRELFRTGRPLPNAVRGRLRWELRATWLGGVRILDRLERSRFDVFRARPTLGWTDAVVIGFQALMWRGGVQGTPPINK
jgi:phytoene/squalene synthetase